MTPQVSVIIPVYNVEKYIEECLSSVMNQTYKNLEIICVDDRTPDKSGEIADDFDKKDSRIKVIHKKKNEGLNMARKTGFENSHGEYITFIDSDDGVNKNYVKNLFESIVRNNVDIAIVGFKKFAKNSEIAQFSSEKIKKPIEKISRDKNELLRYCIGRENFGFNNICQPVAWGRLFRREIIAQTNWKFANYQTNEDEFESIQWFNIAKSIAVKNEALYYYRTNPDSKTSVKYQNRDLNNEHGLEINQFEFAKILYNKTSEYLKNPAIEEDNLWRFGLENRVFLRRRVGKNMLLGQSEMRSLNDNLTMIAGKIDEKMQYKNYEIDQKNLMIARQDAKIASFLSTKRSAKLLAGNVKRMVTKNVNRIRFKIFNKTQTRRDNFSIITANCIGGVIYHKLGMRMDSPTVNLWMTGDDFLIFLENLRDFIERGVFTKIGESWQGDLGFYYPIAKLSIPNHAITINFNHHSSFDEAVGDWNRRKLRINFKKIFILFANEEPTTDFYRKFAELSWKHKIILTTNETPEKYKKLAQKIEYKGLYRGDWTMQPDSENPGQQYFERWDYKKWLKLKR